MYCSVGVRIDEQMLLPFQATLIACYLQNGATYILLLLLSVALALLKVRGGWDPKQVLFSAVQCSEHEGPRAEPMFWVLSDEQVRVESSPGMLHTRDVKALSG